MYLQRVGVVGVTFVALSPAVWCSKTGAAINGNWTSQSDNHGAEMTETHGARRLLRPHPLAEEVTEFSVRSGPNNEPTG